ncbi:MetQ/NlpA family ABC transporter substrate-binding protein [Catenulispora sp. NF23]|uniref:MetQ/NlpA family ABC transporter substrate-binding protein n=1 Tax=Catenulispora pinistramenti TaxID=2705254 RepID=UPI001BA9F083|nr:MetQ/NlpA family ABC transporter substrate-binding protein [Catenulispora pinistramenti]MBS2535900.1 MetQ/NlpA family ABC transporter substrate-binding protein [Catenulispora pinistramenti]
MRNKKLAASLTALVGVLAVGLSACSSSKSSGSGSGSSAAGAANGVDSITVAASPVPHAQILDYIRDNLAAKAGLKLTVKEFTDYVQPNLATQDGEVGANYFQHKPYLDDFNKSKGTDLVPVVGVHLEPLGLYSHKAKSLDQIKDGATIAVPNDATNEGRALKLLADNNLITLKPGAGTTATEKDVANNPKHLKFKPLEAAELPRALDDVDAAVINGNYALQAKLTPDKDALALEKTQDNPYVNLLVVKKGHENDPAVKKLAALLTSDQVKQYIEKTFNGSVIPAG